MDYQYNMNGSVETSQQTIIQEADKDHVHYNVRSQGIFVPEMIPFQSMPELRKIARRSLITGILLVLNGVGYFVLGLFSVPDDPHNAGFGHATTTVVGLLVIGAGSMCIFMKFRLLNVTSWDSLVCHTWFFIVFGCVILGCSVYAFAMLVYLLVDYIGMVDKGSVDHIPDRTKAAIGCVLALAILTLACSMLSCSVSIRKFVNSLRD